MQGAVRPRIRKLPQVSCTPSLGPTLPKAHLEVIKGPDTMKLRVLSFPRRSGSTSSLPPRMSSIRSGEIPTFKPLAVPQPSVKVQSSALQLLYLESSPTSKVVVIDVDPGEKCASLAFCMRSLVTPESGRMAGNQPADLEPIRDGGSCGPHARSQGHFKWLSVADGRHPAPRNVSCNPRTRLQRRWHRHSDH